VTFLHSTLDPGNLSAVGTIAANNLMKLYSSIPSWSNTVLTGETATYEWPGCETDPDCDDGLFCNGVETCDALLGCQGGSAPSCDDGVSCTDDSCNVGSDSCDNLVNDGSCGNGVFCDGVETCDPLSGCQPAGDPCPGLICNESADTCQTAGLLQAHTLTAGGTPVTVNLTHAYVSPIVV